ncbi:unnamed protein product, partial [Amoebophrya sp. A120]
DDGTLALTYHEEDRGKVLKILEEIAIACEIMYTREGQFLAPQKCEFTSSDREEERRKE